MLAGLRILIAEDMPLIAFDLAWAVGFLGGEVIGPVSEVAAGLSLLESGVVSGAILDANLIDRDVTPLACHLLERGVPTIIFSGIGPPAELLRRFPAIHVIYKPASSSSVVGALGRLIHATAAGTAPVIVDCGID